MTQLAGGDDGTYQTNTYFTTYTYYNTLLAGNKPFVITSKQTLENVVTVPLPHTGNFIEHTEVRPHMHTHLKLTICDISPARSKGLFLLDYTDMTQWGPGQITKYRTG